VKMYITRFGLLILLILSFEVSFSIRAATVHATGNMTFATLKPENGEVSRQASYTFTIFIRSNLWMVSTLPLSEPGLSNLMAAECWYNGTNVSRVMRWLTNGVQAPENGVHGVRDEGFVSTEIDLHHQNRPLLDIYMYFLPWLQFASAPYFKDYGEAIPNILAFGPDYVGNDIRLTKALVIYRTAGPLILPEEITFLNNGQHVPPATGVAAGPVSYPPPFDKGFLVGEFQTENWMAVDGGQFPASSKLVIYDPADPGSRLASSTPASSPAPVIPLVRIDMTIATCEVLANDDFSFDPSLSRGRDFILVRDYRAMIGDVPLSYLSSNGVANPGTPKYQKLAENLRKRQIAEAARDGKGSSLPNRYTTRAVLLLCVLVLPMMLIFAQYLKKQKLKQQN
jgi:hypothetical protein